MNQAKKALYQMRLRKAQASLANSESALKAVNPAESPNAVAYWGKLIRIDKAEIETCKFQMDESL